MNTSNSSIQIQPTEEININFVMLCLSARCLHDILIVIYMFPHSSVYKAQTNLFCEREGGAGGEGTDSPL
jgi:hypothetical protein